MQTLVRDIVSGIFFPWDDAFRVGEYVETDNLRGTVEAISIRSLKLRHHRGPVHTFCRSKWRRSGPPALLRNDVWLWF